MLSAGRTSVCVGDAERERAPPSQKRLVRTATQIRIIWMLLSICGTPRRTFRRMGMSSEKLESTDRQNQHT